MAFPGPSIAPLRLTACWQPALGIVFAALGAGLIGAGLGDLSVLGRPLGSLPVPPSIEEASLALVPPTEQSPQWTVLSWKRDEAVSDIDVPGKLEPESRPTTCRRMTLVAGAAPPRHSCGQVAAYLEQTTAMRWLAPDFRTVMAWSKTSGYHALEAGRAEQSTRGLTIDPALACTVGAEYQETPSCSVSVVVVPRDQGAAAALNDGSPVHLPAADLASLLTSRPALPK